MIMASSTAAVRRIGSETRTRVPSSQPPSLTCSTSTTRLGWTCGSTSINCEPPQSVNGICGWKQAVGWLLCTVIMSDQMCSCCRNLQVANHILSMVLVAHNFLTFQEVMQSSLRETLVQEIKKLQGGKCSSSNK